MARTHSKKDMHKLAEYLEKRHKFEKNNKIKIIDGPKELNEQLQKKADNLLPCSVLYSTDGSHWVAIYITEFDDTITILFKDSLGQPISSSVKTILANQLNVAQSQRRIVFKNHTHKPQTDDIISSHLMAVKNLEIIIEGINSNKSKFIQMFLYETKFCSPTDAKALFSNFKNYTALVEKINDLKSQDGFPVFPKVLSDFLKKSSSILFLLRINFPTQYNAFNEIFSLIDNTTANSTNNGLSLIGNVLAINFDFIWFFYEHQFKEGINAIGSKTLDQLLYEMYLNNATEKAAAEMIMPGLSLISLGGKTKSFNDTLLELEVSCNKTKQHFEEWAGKTKNEILVWSQKAKKALPINVEQAIAVMNRAYQLSTNGHRLRTPQIIALFILLRKPEKSGMVCQMHAGEGKTVVAMMLATFKVLQGNGPVDIVAQITPEQESFYQMFGITTATNGKAGCTGPKRCYTADVVYGSIQSFQFDYLRQTRGDRIFGTLILQEVDSMLMNQAGRRAKLYSTFPGMESFRYIYLKIWKELDSAEFELVEQYDQLFNSQYAELKDHIKDEEYQRKIQQLYESYKSKLENCAHQHIRNKIIAVNVSNVDVLIPHHLRGYAKRTLHKWIDNAILAKYMMRENEHYTVRQENNENVIVCVDHTNITWTYGLYQFVQLKHNVRVTAEELTIGGISNYGYIRMYEANLFGLTHTLGSEAEREQLTAVYGVEFAEIPTHKPNNFEELQGIIVPDDARCSMVTAAVKKQLDTGKAVLVVCKTQVEVVSVVKILHEKLDKQTISDLSIRAIQGKETVIVARGNVIIATRLSVREASFVQNTWLHVCLTFCPLDQREKIEIYRAQCGRTAQMILTETQVRELGVTGENIEFDRVVTAIDEAEETRIKEFLTDTLDKLQFLDALCVSFTKLLNDVKETNKLHPERYYLLKDLTEFWSFWMEKQKFPLSKRFSVATAQELFHVFTAKQTTKEIMSGKIMHNPYYGIQQADYFIHKAELAKAKEVLLDAISVSRQSEWLYSAHLKLFEVAINEGQAFLARFYDAVAKIFIFGYLFDVKDGGYKQRAAAHLKDANSAICKELDCIIKATSMTSPHSSLDKQLLCRQRCLNTFRTNTTDMLVEIERAGRHGLVIGNHITGFFQKLEPDMVSEAEELRKIGADTVYELQELPDVPAATMREAHRNLMAGSLLWISIFFVPYLIAVFVIPAAYILITDGLSAIAIDLIRSKMTNERIGEKIKLTGSGAVIITFGFAVTSFISHLVRLIGIISGRARRLQVFKANENLGTKPIVKIKGTQSYKRMSSWMQKSLSVGSMLNVSHDIFEWLKNYILDFFKDFVQKRIEKLILTSDSFNTESVQSKLKSMKREHTLSLFQNILQKEEIFDVGQHICEEIACAVSNKSHHMNWRESLKNFVFDTSVVNVQITTIPCNFCAELTEQLTLVPLPTIAENEKDFCNYGHLDDIKKDMSKLIAEKLFVQIERVIDTLVDPFKKYMIEKIGCQAIQKVEDVNRPTNDKREHYATLKLRGGSSQRAIKRAARESFLEYHPDRNSTVGAADNFIKCRMSYCELMKNE